MTWNWPSLRALVYLRRLVLAQERIATALEASVPATPLHSPKLAEFGVVSLRETSDAWRKDREARAAGVEP